MSLGSQLASRFRAELIGRIIAVGSGAFLAIILARLLNPDEYGLLFLAISVFGILKLFSKLGIAKSAARYITNNKKNDEYIIPTILRFSFILNLCTIVVVSLIVLLVGEHIAHLIGEPELVPFLRVGVLLIVFGTLTTYVRRITQGFEDIQFGALLHTLNRGARLILAVGLVILGFGAIGAFIGYILAYALASTVGLIYIYSNYYKINDKDLSESGIKRNIAEYAIPLTATDTARIIDDRLDTVLVGFFVGPIAVAYYTVSKQIVQFTKMPASALGYTLAPSFESYKENGSPELAANIYEKALTHNILLYVPAAVGLILVADPLVRIVFGPDYLGAVPVIQVFAIYIVLRVIESITSNGLDYLGKARIRAILKTGTSTLNLVLNIILIPTLGVVGAAVATVITHSIYTLGTVYIINFEFSLRLDRILRYVCLVFIVAAIMGGMIYNLVDIIDGIFTLGLVITVAGIVWLFCSLAFNLIKIEKLPSILP